MERLVLSCDDMQHLEKGGKLVDRELVPEQFHTALTPCSRDEERRVLVFAGQQFLEYVDENLVW